MHNQLHAGSTCLRALPSSTADAPPSLTHARFDGYAACTEANATRHFRLRPLPGLFTGGLIHVDIADPFLRTQSTTFQNLLVLVDDHSRLKTVHNLKRKSEATAHARRFLASLTSLLNKRTSSPQLVVGTFDSDNAGKILLNEFAEFLASNGFYGRGDCPLYVHQLNGVAERAIRSIMELTRSSLVTSGSPIAFWDYAVTHVVNVLNRTSVPPNTIIPPHTSCSPVKSRA
eukprot:6172428-Pleurochrysis_carterae.AAC.5